MKTPNLFIMPALVFALCAQGLRAQTPADELTPSGPVSLQIEQQKLEIEKLKLEKEKLELDMQKEQVQATQTAVPAKKPKISDEEIKAYQADISEKAQQTAEANKDKENLLVLDFANAEVWNKGVRYGLHEIYTLAADRKWKMSQSSNEFDPAGHKRILYQCRNMSLLRYENRDRGIFSITAPKEADDFTFLTPEGISFDSGVGQVRNNFQNAFFTYEHQDRKGDFNVLRYHHGRGLSFSDKLEVFFDKEGKLAKLRFGVLDEH